MTPTLAFDPDAFISSAHMDNNGLGGHASGWITAFDCALQKRLAQLLGRNADIWRDRKLKGTDVLDEEIRDQFPRLKVFVSVVSPRYLLTNWSRKDLQEFCAVASKEGGVRVGNRSRIV